MIVGSKIMRFSWPRWDCGTIFEKSRFCIHILLVHSSNDTWLMRIEKNSYILKYDLHNQCNPNSSYSCSLSSLNASHSQGRQGEVHLYIRTLRKPFLKRKRTRLEISSSGGGPRPTKTLHTQKLVFLQNLSPCWPKPILICRLKSFFPILPK